ncbi:MAG: FMN-binding protein [Sphaerochaetaceae bacterium]
MNKIVKVGVTLLIISSFAATSLAVVNKITEPKIAEYEAKVLEDALKEVSGEFEVGSQREISSNDTIKALYLLEDNNGEHTGYILQLEGTGYGGPMTLMAGFLTGGEIIDAKLLNNSETPGLGKKAENKTYMDKFKMTGSLEKEVPIKKEMLDKGDADAVSGSTVTFSGIAKTLAKGSEYVKNLGGK